MYQEWNTVNDSCSIDRDTVVPMGLKSESGKREAREAPMQFLLLLPFLAFLRSTLGAPQGKIYGVNLGSW